MQIKTQHKDDKCLNSIALLREVSGQLIPKPCDLLFMGKYNPFMHF